MVIVLDFRESQVLLQNCVIFRALEINCHSKKLIYASKKWHLLYNIFFKTKGNIRKQLANKIIKMIDRKRGKIMYKLYNNTIDKCVVEIYTVLVT